MTERKTLEKILLTKMINLFTNRVTVDGTSTPPVYTVFCEIAALQSHRGAVHNPPHIPLQRIHMEILMSKPHFWSNKTFLEF